MDSVEMFRSRQQSALNRCQKLIDHYDKLRSYNRVLNQGCLIITIVFSGLTPILILWTELPKPLQALPAALASTAAVSNSIFNFRDKYVIFADTSEALKSERAKFETRTTKEYGTDLTDQKALDNFVNCVESLVIKERDRWRIIMQEENNVSKPK